MVRWILSRKNFVRIKLIKEIFKLIIFGDFARFLGINPVIDFFCVEGQLSC